MTELWNVVSNNSVTPYQYVLYQTTNTATTLNTTFDNAAAVPVAPAPARPSKKEADPVSWLRRRVEEVRWVPG